MPALITVLPCCDFRGACAPSFTGDSNPEPADYETAALPVRASEACADLSQGCPLNPMDYVRCHLSWGLGCPVYPIERPRGTGAHGHPPPASSLCPGTSALRGSQLCALLAGLEPATPRLTAECSAVELQEIAVFATWTPLPMGTNPVAVGADHVAFCSFLNGFSPRESAAVVTDVEALPLRVSMIEVEHEGRVRHPTVMAPAAETDDKLFLAPTPIP